ncbi:hypothetical protein J7U46_00370 [Pelomonas sp. V22]|uniref:hypothetical protein n=1 Tax=Pelomonas sp. V22 TaxID=2822139 RepID=UPI0024A88469|nr:hypothetical protein [Pelomonas sp. V22]MDI4631496.1 hypothetical protein [Pelomonas sp. V22]
MQVSLHRLRQRTRRFGWLVLWLAATVLATQALGQWHGLVHGQKLELKKQALGHDAGSKDCQLFDQLNQQLGFDCAPPTWQALSTAQAVPQALPAGLIQTAPAVTRARGPPSLT